MMAKNARWSLMVALLPFLFQLISNIFLCGQPWYAYWMLVLMLMAPSLVLIFLRKYSISFSLAVLQIMVLAWFSFESCLVGVDSFRGESNFVGGLGALYLISVSIAGDLMVGVVAFILHRRNAASKERQ